MYRAFRLEAPRPQTHFLRDWRRFFRQGLQYRHLTRRPYEHPSRSCGLVVRRSFYGPCIE